MPVTVVVGGQFGSEGKGKIANYLAKTMGATYAVRCGGSNSGHTVVDDNGKVWIFRHLPTSAILPDVKLAICAGSYIDVDVLLKEIDSVQATSERLKIDPEAVIITQQCKDSEKESGLIENIGSTGSGTGAAVAARVLRSQGIKFAKDIEELQPFLANISDLLRESLKRQERIILEGTQGFGLSPLHSGFFPNVTSRDTTAAAFVSEVGLSPLDVDDVVVVVRAFPIRVAGKSGKLNNEISWDDVTNDGGHPNFIQERTTVTDKIRRVAKFDASIVKKAVRVNNASRIAINHVDYVKHNIVSDAEALESYVQSIEDLINFGIDFVGTSPRDVIDRSRGFDGSSIPPGMLSSPQIRRYIKNGLLVHLPEGQETIETSKHLKPATYDMRLGDFAVRFEVGKRKEISLGKEDKSFPRVFSRLVLPPNSLTLVSTHEEFVLPTDVIARFNLKVGLVHQGLLLGTGPIVDPEFSGKLNIPIHNFSSQAVTIGYLDPLIAVEFTKTLPPDKKDYVQNENAKGNQKSYISKAGYVESSVYRAIEESKLVTRRQTKVLWGSLIGAIVAILAIFFTLSGVINDVGSRVDGLHAIYSTQDIIDFKKASNDIANIRAQLNTLSVQSENLEGLSEKLDQIERLNREMDALIQDWKSKNNIK